MTAPARTYPSRRLRDALEPWCAAGATGALRALDPPGGAIYLHRGRVCYAESPPACGVDRLLTASGQLSGDDWRTALAAGRPNRRVGDALVQHGLLARAELETVVLAALYGAALFLLDLDTEVRFEMGGGHLVGQVVDVDLATVCAEVDRRWRVLTDAWPDARVDSHAVVPARRLPGQHVALTALQWEIVANADRRRSPVELARSLGRDTFATLWEARRLARAGLVEPGRPGAVTLPAVRPPVVRGRVVLTGVAVAAEPASGQVGPAAAGPVAPQAPKGARPAREPPPGSVSAGRPATSGSATSGSAPPGAVSAGPAPPGAAPSGSAPSGSARAGPTPRGSQDAVAEGAAPPPLPRRDANGAGWRSTALDWTEPEAACSEHNLVRILDALEALP